MIKAILAVGENGEIGQNGDMPWGRGLPKDLKYFKEKTFDQKVVMGRKTFDSLPFKKGLPDRKNYVLTSEPFNKVYDSTPYLCEINLCRLELRLSFSKNKSGWGHTYWLIGGSSIYKQFWNYVNEVHLTRVKHSFPEADTFFEPDLTGFEKVGDDEDVSGEYSAFVEVWRRIQ